MGHRTRLSINVNKIATLRNSRGKNVPDVLKVSRDLVRFGAEGITVHPRPDGRHIRRDDVYGLNSGLKSGLKEKIAVEFNVEGYPSAGFLTMLEDVRPAQATFVPDPPEVLTSNAGWSIKGNESLLRDAIGRMHAKNIRVSIFIDPATVSASDWDAMKVLGVDRVELYTESYADAYPTPNRAAVTAVYRAAAEAARDRGLGVNAGHDLNLDNLRYLVTEIPWIDEVSIGHALISDALYFGLEETTRRYLACLR
jgi:pyridoxine 5-phosphate synthase